MSWLHAKSRHECMLNHVMTTREVVAWSHVESQLHTVELSTQTHFMQLLMSSALRGAL